MRPWCLGSPPPRSRSCAPSPSSPAARRLTRARAPSAPFAFASLSPGSSSRRFRVQQRTPFTQTAYAVLWQRRCTARCVASTCDHSSSARRRHQTGRRLPRPARSASRATAASFSGTWPRLRDRKKNTRAESPRAGNVRSRGTPGSHSAPSSLDKSVLTSHTRLFQAWGRAPAARSCTCVVALSSQSWRRVCEGSRLRDRRSMSRAVPRADSHVHTAFSRAPGLALC